MAMLRSCKLVCVAKANFNPLTLACEIVLWSVACRTGDGGINGWEEVGICICIFTVCGFRLWRVASVE